MGKRIGYRKLGEYMNIFELLLPRYKLPSKPKLFESFAGIGCQRMALDKLGIDYEVVGISEIDKYALASYKAMHNECPNLGSITDIKGKDMPKTDIFTYSFPCTDLSKAGQQKGLNTNTRSGLIFEVLRLLHEMQEHNKLPQVLIMENVVDLVQVKFIEQWKEIQFEIEQMGYTNYTFTMNAKNYGVAQNRERVFMVSILGKYYYEQPKPILLEKRLKDYLEPNVDESYYLSDKMIKYISTDNGKWTGNQVPTINKEVASTINTGEGSRRTDASNYIADELPSNYELPVIMIKEATIKGYAEAHDGDGVYLNRPHQKRGVVQDQMIQTLKTNGDDVGVVDNMRIRKLTPRECWRLMGIDDSYFDKASQVVSKSQLYKQAGNGIVVDVFAHILKELL
jgi:DNA (cytosine-5)-methyltransferase 1